MLGFALVVALLASPGVSAAQSACEAGETCCFADLEPKVEGAGFSLATPSWMRRCLGSLRMPPAVADGTAEVLRRVMRMYSFDPLVRNSELSDSSLAAGAPNLQVHRVKVDLNRSISDILDSSRVDTPTTLGGETFRVLHALDTSWHE